MTAAAWGWRCDTITTTLGSRRGSLYGRRTQPRCGRAGRARAAPAPRAALAAGASGDVNTARPPSSAVSSSPPPSRQRWGSLPPSPSLLLLRAAGLPPASLPLPSLPPSPSLPAVVVVIKVVGCVRVGHPAPPGAGGCRGCAGGGCDRQLITLRFHEIVRSVARRRRLCCSFR